MTTTSGRLSANTRRSRRRARHDHPRPAEPDRPKVVNRRPGRDQLVPQPAAEAQTELRLHAGGQMPQPGHRRQKRLDPAVQVPGIEVQHPHPPVPRSVAIMGRRRVRLGAGFDTVAPVAGDVCSIDRFTARFRRSQERGGGVELTGRVAERLGPASADRAQRLSP